MKEDRTGNAVNRLFGSAERLRAWLAGWREVNHWEEREDPRRLTDPVRAIRGSEEFLAWRKARDAAGRTGKIEAPDSASYDLLKERLSRLNT